MPVQGTDLMAAIAAGYGFDAPALTLGAAMRGDEALPGAQVRIPLAMMNHPMLPA